MSVDQEPGENSLSSLTDLQRKEALVRANDVRSARSSLKEQLKQSQVDLAPLIAECPSFLASARISVLLQALPGYGPTKVGKLLSASRISPSKTVAGLTPRQRKELVEALKK
jgi:hypothetical protein